MKKAALLLSFPLLLSLFPATAIADAEPTMNACPDPWGDAVWAVALEVAVERGVLQRGKDIPKGFLSGDTPMVTVVEVARLPVDKARLQPKLGAECPKDLKLDAVVRRVEVKNPETGVSTEDYVISVEHNGVRSPYHKILFLK